MLVNKITQKPDTNTSMLSQRPFGNTDLRVSEFGIGCQSFGGGLFREVDQNTTRQVLRRAFDNGVNFFDLCQSYGELNTERLVGDVFRHEREQVIFAVKVGETYPRTLIPLAKARYLLKPVRKVLAPLKTRLHKLMYSQMRFLYSPEHITKAVEDNLIALKTDYLDLCQIHCPPTALLESGEFIDVFQSLRAQGKIRYLGVYTMNVDDALIALNHPEIASIQVAINLLNQRATERLFPEARRRNVAIIAKQALAHGVLTDESQPLKAEFMATSAKSLEKAVDIAQDFRFLATDGRTMAQAALRFVLAFPEVSVVTSGIRNLAEFEEDMGYNQTPALTEDELSRAMAVRHSISLAY